LQGQAGVNITDGEPTAGGYNEDMGKTLGYMVTWTTYGTWLQGETRGYVKDGKVRGKNAGLHRDCEKKLKSAAVRLGRREKKLVRDAIVDAAKRFKQKIYAIAVYSNHVHIVCEYVEVPIGVVVGCYKNAARMALREVGFEGRVWTRGYDKRFCFDETSLEERILYVKRHDSQGTPDQRPVKNKVLLT